MAQVNDRRFLFSSGLGLDALGRRAHRRPPHLKARFGPYYFAYCGFGEFLGKTVARPPRLETVTDGGDALPGVTVLVQKGDYTYFRRIPIHAAQGATLADPTLAGIVLRNLRPRPSCPGSSTASSPPAPTWTAIARSTASPASARSWCAPSTIGRYRCTSTATTSAT